MRIKCWTSTICLYYYKRFLFSFFFCKELVCNIPFVCIWHLMFVCIWQSVCFFRSSLLFKKWAFASVRVQCWTSTICLYCYISFLSFFWKALVWNISFVCIWQSVSFFCSSLLFNKWAFASVCVQCRTSTICLYYYKNFLSFFCKELVWNILFVCIWRLMFVCIWQTVSFFRCSLLFIKWAFATVGVQRWISTICLYYYISFLFFFVRS